MFCYVGICLYGVTYVWISFEKGFELFELFLIGCNKIVQVLKSLDMFLKRFGQVRLGLDRIGQDRNRVGKIQVVLDRLGIIFGQFKNRVGVGYKQVLKDSDRFEQVLDRFWTDLERFWLVWTSLDTFGYVQIWLDMFLVV